jgi:hypothetical protein
MATLAPVYWTISGQARSIDVRKKTDETDLFVLCPPVGKKFLSLDVDFLPPVGCPTTSEIIKNIFSSFEKYETWHTCNWYAGKHTQSFSYKFNFT